MKYLSSIGCDPNRTSNITSGQQQVQSDLSRLFQALNIKTIYYKGGIFEKYFVESLNLNIDLIDLEGYPYFVPPSSKIDFANLKTIVQCEIHKNIDGEHCAVVDVLKYYYYSVWISKLKTPWCKGLRLKYCIIN